MDKYKSRFYMTDTGIKGMALILLLGALAGCQRAADNPMDPQAPPKPKALALPMVPEAMVVPADGIVRAIFTYSSSPLIHFQDGQGIPIKAHVIRT